MTTSLLCGLCPHPHLAWVPCQSCGVGRYCHLPREVRELSVREMQVGEQIELEGRVVQLTDAGWRRVDRGDHRKTHELSPLERRLLRLICK